MWLILMSYIFFLFLFCLFLWVIFFFIFDNKIFICNIELWFYFGCIWIGYISVCVWLFCCVGINKWIMNKISSEISFLCNDLFVLIIRVVYCYFCVIYCVLWECKMLIKISFVVMDGWNY